MRLDHPLGLLDDRGAVAGHEQELGAVDAGGGVVGVELEGVAEGREGAGQIQIPVVASATVPPGEAITVTYSVTVNDATALGDGVLLNAVTSPDCFDPPVTDPDSGSEPEPMMSMPDAAADGG